MSVVVTGASGHLGGAVVRALLDRGERVRAFDLTRGETLDDLDVDFREGNVLDAEAVRAAFTGADVVCHLAAKISVVGDPDGSVAEVNVTGARTAAQAALATGVKRFVHCSSVHAFDLEAPAGALNESAARSEAPHLPAYDRSKWAGEQAVREVVADGLDAVFINPTGIIGPLDFVPSRMGKVFLGIRDNRLRFVIPGGFDWVDVRDVAAGALAAADEGATGTNYLLAGTHGTIREINRIALEVNGIDADPIALPRWVARAWGPLGTRVARSTGSPWAMTSESLHALENSPPIDATRARTELGYRPRPLTETIRDIYEWFDHRR